MRRKFFLTLLMVVSFIVSDSLRFESRGEQEESPSVSWKNEGQKALCQGNLEKIKGHFLKARDSAFLGDSCSAADHAKEFLTLVDTCKMQCPEGFLEKNGFHTVIINNIKAIHVLGEQRCKR